MSSEWDIVRDFEQEIADFSGAKYGISVESCTAALFLSCLYKKISGNPVWIPKRTYPGVACSIINAGGHINFLDKKWQGDYELYPFGIYDAAKRFKPDMYIPKSLYCLSFHAKKRIAIGRGGMILTDDLEADRWLKKVRYDGRSECSLEKDKFEMIGWNMYMSPKQAARGLQLFHACDDYDDLVEFPDYPDLSQYPIYKGGIYGTA